MLRDCRSPVSMARLATVVLGILVLALGWHSHFESSWNKGSVHGVKLYTATCGMVKNPNVGCPSISKEQFFIAMIVIFFGASAVGLIMSCFMDLKSHPLMRYDFGYHVVAAILLMIAAILYISSAEQISNLEAYGYIKFFNVDLRREEKLVAGTFTVIQSFLYGFVASLIAKGY